MKITVDCGSRYRYPGGDLSGLPEVLASRKLRDKLFSAASSAIEELGGNADLLELIGLSQYYNPNFGGQIVQIRVITLDPVVDGEDPSSRKAAHEVCEVTREISAEELKMKILSFFWKSIEQRRSELKQRLEGLPSAVAPKS
jgi:hypothetical protein